MRLAGPGVCRQTRQHRPDIHGRADRDENVRRIGYVADLLSRNGVDVVCSVISPFRAARDEVRARRKKFRGAAFVGRDVGIFMTKNGSPRWHERRQGQGIGRRGIGRAGPDRGRAGGAVRAGLGPDTGTTRFLDSTAMEVAEAGYAGLMAGRREIVPGFLNKGAVFLLPLLPKSVVLTLISWSQQNRTRLR